MEDLADNLMEEKMMTRRTRMRLEVAIRTRGEIIQIVPMIKTIEEEEEGKELEEEASVEIVSTTMKKDIEHLNILSVVEGRIEEMNGMLELCMLMKM